MMPKRLEKTIELLCGPQRAFELFTDSIHAWWPQSHVPSGQADSRVVLNQADGLYEQTPSGIRHAMGAVRVWSPPHELELDFYLGSGPEQPTRVSVRFEPQGQHSLLTLVHEPTELSMAVWNQFVTVYHTNWDLCLSQMRQAS